MRFKKLNYLSLPFLVVFLFLSSPFVFAEESWTTQLMREIKDIKEQLSQIEKNQTELLAKHDEIMKELDRIRIWVHHR